MVQPFTTFETAVRAAAPRLAVLLGSGLAGAASEIRARAIIDFTAVPGLAPTTVAGHPGRLVLGDWHGRSILIAFGRLHFYEGHSWEAVTGLVQVLARLGMARILLTNAAGGIHPSLGPGSLMAIRGHIQWLGPGAWRTLAEDSSPSSPYAPRLIASLCRHETSQGRELPEGTYAALTGPCYETAAEIRALRALGADAVGMSTAREAETAAALGLEVAAISCITNRAAGLEDRPLDHRDVLNNARLAVARLADLLASLLDF